MFTAVISVQIDLSVIRRNVEQIRQKTGVSVLGVVKADAYGLGCAEVAGTIDDLVDGFCIFSVVEAQRARLWDVGRKPILVLGPPGKAEAQDYLMVHARPAVSSIDQAERLRTANPVLSVDTGMQRFACPADQIDAVLRAGGCTEAFTHATQLQHVHKLMALVGNRGLRLHAAASALLDEPGARLDAVRPGIAMYRGSLRVSALLIEARDSVGPAGYTQFVTRRFGVIPCGYSQGLRPGPCSINGSVCRILEVGMQTAFVEIGPSDKLGDEVILLGNNITEAMVARAWNCTEQEVVLRLAGAGERRYSEK